MAKITDTPRGPFSRPSEPAASSSSTQAEVAAKPPGMLSKLSLPLANGFVLPRVEDAFLGKSSSLGFENISANWRQGTADWTGMDDPKRNLGMHGAAGAFFGYLPLRNSGETSTVAALGAAMVGVGIELGQSLEQRHRVDYGDIGRTAVVGSLLGEGLYQLNKWASEKYADTAKPVFRALSLLTDPNHTFIELRGDGFQVNYRISF